jgi:hypothetical protein
MYGIWKNAGLVISMLAAMEPGDWRRMCCPGNEADERGATMSNNLAYRHGNRGADSDPN